jgi:hypothetical protein
MEAFAHELEELLEFGVGVCCMRIALEEAASVQCMEQLGAAFIFY